MLPFYIIWALWLILEIVLNRVRRSGTAGSGSKDSGTMRRIWWMIALAIPVGVGLTFLPGGQIGDSLRGPYAGLGIIVAGMILRFVAIFSLGRMFTVDVAIRQDHRLKSDGLYTWIRHPSYTGSLISFAGFGVSMNSLYSLVAVTLLVFYAFTIRIRLEEQVLEEEFGEEYRKYKARSYRLVPGIY